jgi:hypothetical protein
MKDIVRVFENMDKIRIVYDDTPFAYIIDSSKESRVCSINADKSTFEVMDVTDYEDVYRILKWLGFKNSGEDIPAKTGCVGLNCESCSGCGYNALTELFNCRKVLSKYLTEAVMNNFTFIGSLKPTDILISPSPFKKYVSIEGDTCFLWERIEKLTSTEWHSKIVDEAKQAIINLFYIEQLIPEVLSVPGYITELYGTYENMPVLWQYRKIYHRYRWTFTVLK